MQRIHTVTFKQVTNTRKPGILKHQTSQSLFSNRPKDVFNQAKRNDSSQLMERAGLLSPARLCYPKASVIFHAWKILAGYTVGYAHVLKRKPYLRID